MGAGHLLDGCGLLGKHAVVLGTVQPDPDPRPSCSTETTTKFRGPSTKAADRRIGPPTRADGLAGGCSTPVAGSPQAADFRSLRLTLGQLRQYGGDLLVTCCSSPTPQRQPLELLGPSALRLPKRGDARTGPFALFARRNANPAITVLWLEAWTKDSPATRANGQPGGYSDPAKSEPQATDFR
jgi:hypothetical protein